MLKWIVGGKADHPLADVKHTRALLAALPANDGAKALAEISNWLESLVNVDSFRLERLYELIDVLDSAARNHQRKLVQDYLAMSRQQKFHENKLWTAGAQFAKALGDAYTWFLEQYEAGSSGAAAVRRFVPVACARAHARARSGGEVGDAALRAVRSGDLDLDGAPSSTVDERPIRGRSDRDLSWSARQWDGAAGVSEGTYALGFERGCAPARETRDCRACRHRVRELVRTAAGAVSRSALYVRSGAGAPAGAPLQQSQCRRGRALLRPRRRACETHASDRPARRNPSDAVRLEPGPHVSDG